MKKFTRFLAVLGVMGLAGAASAGTTATFDITVNINAVLSVAITTGGTVSLGAVAPTSLNNNLVAVVVVNDSAGLVEDYQLDVTDSSAGVPWRIAAAQGANDATLHAKFNSALPGNLPLDGPGNFDADDQLIGPFYGGSPVLSGDTGGDGAFAGDQDGQQVNPSEANNLWIRFGAPTTDSSGGAAQTFTVSVIAVNP